MKVDLYMDLSKYSIGFNKDCATGKNNCGLYASSDVRNKVAHGMARIKIVVDLPDKFFDEGVTDYGDVEKVTIVEEG